MNEPEQSKPPGQDRPHPHPDAYSRAETGEVVTHLSQPMAKGQGSAGPPASVQARFARGLGDRLGPAVTFATSGLEVEVLDGRASIYLAALSSNLIALAFRAATVFEANGLSMRSR
jgi:hypothetical protein